MSEILKSDGTQSINRFIEMRYKLNGSAKNLKKA